MFKTICFDFDSTLSHLEGIDELAKFLKKPQVIELTKGSMEGKLDVKEAYNRRLDLLSLENIHLDLLGHVYKSNLTDGALELCKILNYMGKRLVIVSGGFKDGILPSAKLLGIDEVHAIEFEIIDEKCKVLESPLLCQKGKANLLETLDLEEVCFIGDGFTDYETKDVVSSMIPYFGVEKRPFVEECKLEAFGGKNLLGLLPLLLNEEELKQVQSRFPQELDQGIQELFTEGNLLFSSKSKKDFIKYSKYKYFLPGPSALNDDIETISNNMIGHRSQEFSLLYKSIQRKFSQFLSWSPDFLILGASATGMMEAVLANITPCNILSIRSGAFSDRWAEIAKVFGHHIDYFDVLQGGGIDQEGFIKTLQRGQFDFVLMTHSESSNGILNDVEYLSKLVKEHSRSLVLVDGVSSVGGVQFSSDHMDGIIFGSQKCLALNPGLSFLWFSKELREKIEQNPKIKTYYFDLRKHFKSHDKDTVAFTPPVQTIQKLEKQLDSFLKDLSAHYNKYKKMSEIVWSFCTKNNLEMYANESHRSLTVSNIKCPIEVKSFIDQVFDQGHLIASGYGDLKNSYFRIGHMGILQEKDIEDLLQKIQEILHHD